MFSLMPIMSVPRSPLPRSGLPACAIFKLPGKRTSASSGDFAQVFDSVPKPPMFEPEPGM